MTIHRIYDTYAITYVTYIRYICYNICDNTQYIRYICYNMCYRTYAIPYVIPYVSVRLTYIYVSTRTCAYAYMWAQAHVHCTIHMLYHMLHHMCQYDKIYDNIHMCICVSTLVRTYAHVLVLTYMYQFWGWIFMGGSSSSRFWSGNIVNWNHPRGGGFLLINLCYSWHMCTFEWPCVQTEATLTYIYVS